MRFVAVLAVAGCAHAAAPQATLALRPACGPNELWDGHACKSTREATAKLAVSTQALTELKLDEAQVALDAAEHAGPLDHTSNVTLWEQRGIAAAYADDEATARRAFDMMLALDSSHFLSYALSPKATLVFEKVLGQSRERGAPAIDVSWDRGQRVGEPVALDVEVLADPKQFITRATLFVRTRGEATWRAADLPLDAHARDRHVLLPGIQASKPVSLELYLHAYDARGNEVLRWADATRPRELPLQYDPPTPWYRTWWGISSIVGVSAAVVGGIVYAVTLSPPDKIDGDVTVN
jgi:hypothetical protein